MSFDQTTVPLVEVVRPGRLRRLLCAAALVTLGIAAFEAMAIGLYGGHNQAIARLQGYSLFVSEQVQSVGAIRPGSTTTCHFVLENLTGDAVRIVGTSSSCSCTMADFRAPYVLNGGSILTLPVVVKPKLGRDTIDESVTILTDVDGQREIVLRVRGRVVSDSVRPTDRSQP